MKLYIQIKDGSPINHPALEDNLIQAFGQIPNDWEAFTRVERPTPTLYQLIENEHSVYSKVDGVWTDVWFLRDMTAEEIQTRQQFAKDEWLARDQASNWSTWIFDEATCTFLPPVPRPAEDGKIYRWSGADNDWKEAPAYPSAGGPYKFDFSQWTWVIA